MHTRFCPGSSASTALASIAGLAMLLLMSVASLAPARAAEPPASPSPESSPQATAPTSTPAAELPDTPAGRHLRWALDVFNGGEPGDLTTRFTPEFLRQVPADKFLALSAQLRAGPFAGGPVQVARLREGATPLTATAELVTASQTRFSLWVNVHEASGLIDGLLIRPAASEAPKLADFAALDAELTKLPGKVNCGIFRITGPAEAPEITPVHTLNGDARLALGSTFKLYILGALAELVEAGGAAWDEELEIRQELKSLPSGELQLQPAGVKFPLSHFADKMISISDNTATDHLLVRAGRERVEAYMARLHAKPALNRPFLSTLEMFRIKLSSDRTLPGRYAAADETARRAMLAPGGEIDGATPNLLLAAAWKKPVEVERVEWFASPIELARLMADLRRLESRAGLAAVGHAMRINPGLPLNRGIWPGIAFKGGSEPGVISGTWLLKRADGAEFVVTVSWTNPDDLVDEARWIGLCTAAVNLTGLAAGN